MNIGRDVQLLQKTGTDEWDRLLTCETTVDDRTDFTRFVEQHLRFVFRVAHAVLRNAADAEDIAQDVFLKLYRKKSWKGLQDEKAFLARATWRLCMDHRSSAHFRNGEEQGLACEFSDPETAAIENQRNARIHRLIDALPDKLRRPLALSAIEEMTAARIAAAMDLPEGTVRRRIAEARALIKNKMSRMEDA